MRPVVLRAVLLSLLILSLAVTLQKLVAFGAPMPELKAPVSLRVPGFRATSLMTLPAKPGKDISRGQGRRFRLDSTGQPPVLLTLLPVRGRKELTLSMFSVPALEPSFVLKQARLQRFPRSSNVDKRPPEELLFGHGSSTQGQSLDVLRLQTCLARSGAAVVSAEPLRYELERLLRNQLKQAPLQAILTRYLGPQANNNRECLALQLETDSGPAAEPLLLSAWRALREELAN